MNASTLINRTNINRFLAIVAMTVAGTWLSVSTPAAFAGPKPLPVTPTASPCSPGMDGMAARLREGGLTAQAANNATLLTYRECLREHAPQSRVNSARK